MNALANQKNNDILRHFIPLNSLPKARFDEICNSVDIEECAKGTVLFEQGDEVKEFIYLISGMISLYAGEMEMETIVTGSESARFAIAHHIPRKVKAVTKSRTRIVRIATHKLDMASPKDEGQTYLVDEVDDQGGDWMTTMLQSPVFQRLPASNLQKVMMQMEEVAFEAGDVVVKQGDEADFYYIIKSGDCELIRQASDTARPVKLAELHNCDAFGEDALLSGNPRNVTVRMKGKGQMLRLSKKNFISLVKEPVLKYVDFEEGKNKVAEGASWLDVRGTDAFEEGRIEGSVNIPFFSLRMKIAELRHDQLQVLVCANGRTSEAAAFLLLKFGFNALILKEGMQGMHDSIDIPLAEVVPEPVVKTKTVEVVSEISTLSKTDSSEDKKLLKEAENKILELEKLCAQSNEKLNALELERNKLQQHVEQQATAVDDLRAATKVVEKQLEAKQATESSRDAELNEALLGERKRSEELRAELELALQEVESSSQLMVEGQQKLDDLVAKLSEKDELAATQAIELGRLKETLDNTQGQGAEKVQELDQKLSDAEQLNFELSVRQAELEKLAEEAEFSAGELLEAKAQLERQVEQLSLDSTSGLVAKDEQIQALNEQLTDVSFNLAAMEESKTESDALLKEALNELEQLRANDLEVLQQHKADAESKSVEFEAELSALRKQLDEKENELEKRSAQLGDLEATLSSFDEVNTKNDSILQEKQAEIELLSHQLSETETQLTVVNQRQVDLEATLSSLDEVSTKNDSILHDRQAEIELLTHQLNEAKTQLTEISQRQVELELSLSEKESLLGDSAQQLADVVVERDALQENLQGQDASLTNALDAQEQLKEQLKQALQEIDSLRETEKSGETVMDELKESNVQLQKEFEGARSELEMAKTKALNLEEETEKMRQQLDSAEASLSAVTDGNKSLESELRQRLSDMEENLAESSQSKVDIERQLQTTLTEKEQLEQQLSTLQDEQSSGLDSQQQLTERLALLTHELEEVAQAGEAERLESADLLQHAQSRYKAAEFALNEQAKNFEQSENALSEKFSTIQAEFKLSRDQVSNLDAKLASLNEDNDTLQKKLIDAEAVLSDSTGGQQVLLEQLEKARSEVNDYKNKERSTIDSYEASSAELKQQIVALNDAVEKSQNDLQLEQQRYQEVSKELTGLSAGIKSDESELKQQLIELTNKFEVSEEEKSALKLSLQNIESERSSESESVTKTKDELETLKQERIIEQEESKELQQKIKQLESSLQRVEQEKEQILISAVNDEDDKTTELAKQLLAVQKEAELSSLKIDELMQKKDAGEKDKAALEEKLAESNKEKEDLQQRIEEVVKKPSAASDNVGAESRIKELEKQLDEAATYLLDLEIKLETSSTINGDEPENKVDNNALEIVKSELNLVREQTEKDIKAMQVKIENSEKMNMALKKKILSMQTIANQDFMLEDTPEEKKKGWWKK
jgi:chromosome segregation ATPase/CRP-like cAMP-binding protein/rhodanese-related sulfurtransferase